jgi:asparagine synthase (glutamine-hydrolysing)
MQLLDYNSYLPSDILFKVDVASMYHGLEVRVPLLDHRVVELAASIPSSLKVRMESNGRPNHLTGKYIFRQVARRCLSPRVVNRPKRGFGLPLHRWMDGVDIEQLRHRLFDPASRLAECFAGNYIEASLRRRQNSGPNGSRLWTLNILSEWFRQHPRAVLN